jgi:regulator of protease activity HflC (stomatin/prohibitin superfamily)
MSTELYFFLFILVIILLKSLKILRKDERIAIFRLGQFLTVAGPGVVFIIPFIDRGVKVNLTQNIPSWQALSKTELDEKVKAFVLSDS